MIYDSMGKNASMHLTELKCAKDFKKTISYATVINTAKASPNTATSVISWYKLIVTYDSMGKRANMHLTELNSIKYFEKDIILPYCHLHDQGLPNTVTSLTSW